MNHQALIAANGAAPATVSHDFRTGGLAQPWREGRLRQPLKASDVGDMSVDQALMRMRIEKMLSTTRRCWAGS